MGEILWSLQTFSIFCFKEQYKPLREYINNLIPNCVSFKVSFYLLQSKSFFRISDNPFVTFQGCLLSYFIIFINKNPFFKRYGCGNGDLIYIIG